MQMVQNDKENYALVNSSAGPVLALAIMRNKFESMPGNNPTRIPALSVDYFRAPYTGWYKAHFSCSSVRQDTTTVKVSSASDPDTIYLDGFYFVITARNSNRVTAESKYDPVDGQSLFDVGQFPNSAAIGSVIARASFVRSGMSVPVSATGYKWLVKGEATSWNIYTYIANNNYDLLTAELRNYGRIVMNSRQVSSTSMGYGSPRAYSYGAGGATVPTTYVDNPAAPASNDYKTISNLFSPNDAGNRYSYLMVQYVGQGGMPGELASSALERDINEELLSGQANTAYEV
jgi:hypothetical protein